jgi:serine/threonine protein kinase
MNAPTRGGLSANFGSAGALLEAPGACIGRYKLLQLIGEGGSARSSWPSRPSRWCASVALKIIKLGMDTKQVMARFEAERQALAMMDHPNIARVLDAGATGVADRTS